jgi:hypothetical protein
MKTCSMCKKEKPKTKEFFPERSDRDYRFTAACRVCLGESRNRTYQKRKASGGLMRDYLTKKYGNNPCEDCGHWFPWCAMDFHHRPEEEKSYSIGRKGHTFATTSSITRIEKEIAKCDLVCSKCHRIRTHA